VIGSDEITAIAAALTATAGLIVAIGGVIREIRMMRADIVQAVESHMLLTIDAIQKGQLK
jgi:hypothetical protein